MKEYKLRHNESTEQVDFDLAQFQACDKNKICCGSALVEGMTVEQLENLHYPDLERIFNEAFMDDKAYILEKI